MSRLKTKTQSSKLNKRNIYSEIYKLVKKIPVGKVTTYGEVGKELGISARVVGWALHGNRDNEVPCHRVVNKDGRLAKNFALEGWKEQRRRLLMEGVKFSNKRCVDLKKCRYTNS